MILLLEVLSVLVVFFPTTNSIVAMLLAVACVVVTLFCPEYGLAILSGELLIGSKGGLFRFGGDAQNNGGIPIRILLFSSVLLGWLIWSIRYRTWKNWPAFLKGRRFYAGLALVLAWAFIRGLSRQNPFLFGDANSWGMWLLLLPVIDIVSERREELRRILVPTVLAALLWLPIKTLLVFYLFSHAFHPVFLEGLYLWIRRTGVGEVTRASGTTFRVFFQSHIYALGVVFALWCKQVTVLKLTRKEWALLVLSLAEILVSLSRSFWLGLAAGGLLLLIWFLVFHRYAWRRVFATGIASSVLAVLLVVFLLWIPLPPGEGSLTSLVRTRIDAGEDAATSRWQLLPVLWRGIGTAPLFGSGFGATLTYESHDPRIVQATGGTYTTYAFEWGWLDLWYKFGLIGALFLVILLIRLGYCAWCIDRSSWVTWAILIGLVTITTVHFFTPYLNHPLGIGALLALEGLLAWSRVSLRRA